MATHSLTQCHTINNTLTQTAYFRTHLKKKIMSTVTECSSLKEGEEVDELSLGDAEREDGLCLLCNVLLFSLGAWHEGLSRTKLEDVPKWWANF
jgi:hypothetical protein